MDRRPPLQSNGLLAGPLWIAHAVVAIIIGLAGLALDFYVISDVMVVSDTNRVARSLPNMLVYYWTFLTHLSNLGLILVYVSALTPWSWLEWFRQPVTRAGIAGLITLVMLFFHIMLAPNYQFTGALFYANYMLHYICPVPSCCGGSRSRRMEPCATATFR